MTISRRKLITTGLAAAAGVTGLGVADQLARSYGLIPPDSGGMYGPGETLTYAAPTPAHAPLHGPRVQPQQNFPQAFRQ